MEFKRLSKHYARESHNNGQRSNKRHKIREAGSEGDQKKASKEETEEGIGGKKGEKKSIDFYMQH